MDPRVANRLSLVTGASLFTSASLQARDVSPDHNQDLMRIVVEVGTFDSTEEKIISPPCRTNIGPP